MRLYKFVIICVLLGMMVISIGCSESAYTEKKQAMTAEWDKATAAAKIPVIEDMIEQGQISQAKKTVQQCVRADPELPQVYVLAGRIHLIEKHLDKAYEAFSRALELDPEIDEAWHLLGSLAVLKRDYPEALEYFKRALALDAFRTEYILSASDVLIETDQIEQARELLETGLANNTRDVDLHVALARLVQVQGQTEEAINIYETCESLNGPLPEIVEPCGYAYMTDRQWSKAADKFQALLKSVKDSPERYHMTMRSLAMCLYNAGQYENALSWYDKLSVIFRDDADIWVRMGYAALGSNDPKRAAYCGSKSLKCDASSAQGYALLGSAQYLQGQYEESLRTFYKITDDEEMGAFAWFMTARCYQQLGQNIQANAAFERAEKLDPDSELVSTFTGLNQKAVQ